MFSDVGAPPSNVDFNTAANRSYGTLPTETTDLNWSVATDSITELTIRRWLCLLFPMFITIVHMQTAIGYLSIPEAITRETDFFSLK